MFLFSGKPLLLLQCRSMKSKTTYLHQIYTRWRCKTQRKGDASVHTVSAPSEAHRLMVIQPEYKSGPVERPYVPADCKLEEASSLVEAISGWEVCRPRVAAVRQVHNKYFFGKGTTSELKAEVRGLGENVTGVFINTPTLTPLQHTTLEQVFRRSVFDRFGVVLHIFKERAQTSEAKLQVELAEIPYNYMKLFGEEGKRMPSGGIGETSMETRKFMMNRRLRQLQRELKEVRRKRKELREQRTRRYPVPIVAVVGYTNAGKTTLIKALSRDSAMIPKDMLFATLDSTLHAGRLPCGLPVLYVDTIGFISDLPVKLVESFASTLEDSIHADVLVHVIDGSHPQAYAQRANVLKVLEQLDLRPQLMESLINVVNKTDKISLEENRPQRDGDVCISATEGTDLKTLEMRIEEAALRATNQTFWSIELPASGPELSWLYSSNACSVCQVTPVEGAENRLLVHTVLSQPTLCKFVAKFSSNKIIMSPMDHSRT